MKFISLFKTKLIKKAQEHASKQADGKLKKGYQESDINENIRKHIDNMVKSYTEDDNPI